LHTQNNNLKTRCFYIFYSDKTYVFDQSEHVQGIIKPYLQLTNKLNKCKYSLSQNDILKYNVSDIFKNQPQNLVLLAREKVKFNYKLVYL